MRVDDFDFDLPEHLIALRPARPRDSAKLLAMTNAGLADHQVSDLPSLLRADDVLVFNDTRTIPAALTATRPARQQGAPDLQASVNLHQRLDGASWKAFARPAKRLAVGDTLHFADGLCAQILARGEGGEVTLTFDRTGAALDLAIAAAGMMPLPPYIARKRPVDGRDDKDYQTIYAKADGSVATPTAGLHFTEALLGHLVAKGVTLAQLTLHVGAGTFLPVKAERIEDHHMHSESYVISAQTAQTINQSKAQGRRIVAVGTTTLRTLESATNAAGEIVAGAGQTDIFITPGHRFKLVDGLMTNFHLPRSTLLMLVAAFVGYDAMRSLYAHAIAQSYRFYSYGDASLLWRVNQA
jgi:S-adenosylmethionine:tRNA ribosyltransferase-isomerase